MTKRSNSMLAPVCALVKVTVDRASGFFILWTQTCTDVQGAVVGVD